MSSEPLIRTYDDIAAEDSERKLRQSEERFRAFVLASSDVVYSMSPDWREMRYLVGKDFIADTTDPSRAWLERYIPPDDQSQVLVAIQEAIRNRSTFELEHRVIRADGTLGWTFSRAIPLLNAEGEIVEWFGAARDITQRRQAEEALRDADRRKDEFIATLAHELRNPLAPMTNALQLLRLAKTDDPFQNKARAILERQLELLKRLVDDLLEMARITSGRLQLQRERVLLDVIVERAVESVRPLIEARRHELRLTVAPRPIELHADPARIEQVLVNLLNNAAKYTDEGGRIELAAELQGDQAIVRVQDTGIGIDAELLPRLFQPFTQGPRSLARSNGGLGIGLALVRRLVEMHNGTVEAKSSAGQGSTFTVKIPARVSGAPEFAATNGPANHPTAQPVRVLVVDDDVDSAQSLAMLLGMRGHTVRVCHNGAAALSIARRFRPEIAFLDIGLPVMDGHVLARRMRADSLLGNVELVALTGFGRADDERRSGEAGFAHHLLKPVEFSTVEHIVEQVAKRRNA